MVSVIMPVRNGAGVIGRAIDSVQAQRVPLELIVINDASADDTDGIVRAYRDGWRDLADKRLVYIENRENLGAAASRNLGVSLAEAPWVAFLDADDWWTEDKLERQLKLLEREGRVLCSTARELMDAGGNSLGRVIHVRETVSYHDLLFGNSINCSSVVVRTDVMRAFPMEYEDSHEDYIAWLRILKACGPACAIDEPLLKYRMSAGSKSGNKLRSAAMTFRVYRHLGFNPVSSVFMFISYAVHGVIKYAGIKESE